MIDENKTYDIDTLLQAIELVKEEGFSVEFVCRANGFFDPKGKKTYVLEDISKMEFIRIQSPLSEPDEESIIYLLETMDDKRGWISDSFGYASNQQLTKNINKIEEYLVA